MLRREYLFQYISTTVLLLLVIFCGNLRAQCPISLGADTTPICFGDTTTLNPGVGFVSYQWSATAGGSNNQTVDIFTTGSYSVTVNDGTNICSDTTYVLVNPLPSVNLGADDTICFGDQKTLQAGAGFLNYTWQDGSTLDSFIVQNADTFHVSVVDVNGCSNSDTVIIGQHSLPIVSLGNDTSICFKDTITLAPVSTYTSYSWSTGETTPTIDTDTAGTYFLTIEDNNGCENSTGIVVSIDSLPIVNLGGNDTICDNPGASKFLNAGAGFVSYLWNTTAASQTVIVDIQDTYWVEVIDTNGCTNRDSMYLHLRSGPNISLGNDTSICIGDSLTLDPGQGFTSYLWNDGATDSVNTIDTAGIYSVIVTDSFTCQSFDTINVGINFLPIVNIGNDLDYCENSTMSQLVDGGAGFAQYLWMDGAVTQINTIIQTDDTVWVEVTDINGCSARDTLFVIENALPLVDLGPDDTICSNQTKSFNAGTAGGTIVGYSWSNSSNSQSIVLSFNPLSVTTPLNNTYSVTVTDNNNCQNSDTVNLLVNPLPSPNLGNDLSYCIGDPFSAVLDPGTFDSYQWNTTSTSPTLTIGAIAGIYTVTVTDVNGCQNSDDINIIENLLPVPSLGNDSSYCQGTPLNIVVAPGTFDSYSWDDGSTQPFLVVTVADTYSVTVTDHNGCQNSDEIIFEELLNPLVNMTPDLLLCEGDTVNQLVEANMIVLGNYNFLWNTGITTASFVALDTGSYVITITDNNNGCTTIDSTVIDYFHLAKPNLGDDGILCEGEALELSTNSNTEGYTFTWNTSETTSSINIFSPGTYWVEMNAINGTCLGIRDSITLTLGALPVVDLGSDKVLCEGQELTFLNDQSPFPFSTYTWQDGTIGPEYKATETGIYRVIVSNKCGFVSDEVQVDFQDCYNVWIPNTFTPNGDGDNEVFKVSTDQELIEFSLVIYNRYGDVVFKTNTPFASWDGRVNGENSPTGVYLYKVSYVSAFDTQLKRREKIGHINLIR